MSRQLTGQNGICRHVMQVAAVLLCMPFVMTACALWAETSADAPVSVSGSEYTDLLSGRQYCDTAPLDRIEGIWEYPDDGVTVLIRRQGATTGIYEVVAIDSEDTRITPGNIIGQLESSPDPRQFRLTLFTKARKGVLGTPAQCLATLSTEGDALFVKSKKTKIIFNPSVLLPRFWRVARIRTSDPLDKMPAGMIKVYPSYDGNGSSRRQPRYL